jgi:hypothetical protein
MVIILVPHSVTDFPDGRGLDRRVPTIIGLAEAVISTRVANGV